jgi:hypothetical protein
MSLLLLHPAGGVSRNLGGASKASTSKGALVTPRSMSDVVLQMEVGEALLDWIVFGTSQYTVRNTPRFSLLRLQAFAVRTVFRVLAAPAHYSVFKGLGIFKIDADPSGLSPFQGSSARA